jgi:hypothetical protein
MRVQRTWRIQQYACDVRSLRHAPLANCIRLFDERIPAADGISLPTDCFPDGVVYGVVVDQQVVAVAYAHQTDQCIPWWLTLA